ncbi:hypothetical protein [Pseudonocardia sp.]|uniref:hypothetical protein n=1 Tax=Pseudonocardia sp. TaxID=60912 RepID=UPI0026102074|nr:hypothetical protein [Pseudonocardia sp.]
MAFRWRYLDASAATIDGPDERFDDQQEAESWFSDVWPELREAGVDAVVLLDGDEEVYGPMSLQDGT